MGVLISSKNVLKIQPGIQSLSRDNQQEPLYLNVSSSLEKVQEEKCKNLLLNAIDLEERSTSR